MSSPFLLPRSITPFVAPPGFPADVAPNQIIFASHINAIRDSVAIWPGNVNGNAKNLTGAGTVAAVRLEASAVFPQIVLRETDAAADAKIWKFGANSGVLSGYIETDSEAAFGGSFVEVYRSGNSITSLVFPPGLIGINGIPPPAIIPGVLGGRQYSTRGADSLIGWNAYYGSGGFSAVATGYAALMYLSSAGSLDLYTSSASATAGAVLAANIVARFMNTGHLIQSVPASAPPDAPIGLSQMGAWINEAGNALTFRVRYSSGVYKTGTIALV